MGRINQRLNGLNPLSYLGENSYQPPEFVTDRRAPTATDVQNFQLGTIWLDVTNNPPGAEDVYMLVSQASGIATWVNFAPGALALESLTGNSGGAVFGDPSDNINVLGDTTTITVAGNPGTNTLTVSAVGTGVVSSLTGNSGGAVFPTANNTNILGTGVITVVGNPGTSTLTITPSGDIASSFPTDSGTAVPAAGALTVAGGTGIGTTGAGSTVTINADATVPLSFPTDSGTATPAANALTIRTNRAGLNCGSSVLFAGSGANVTLNVTDASSNTIMGNNAGNLTLTATNQVGFGSNVFNALTTGGSQANTAMGYGSMAVATTAGLCSAFGNLTLGANVSSASNSAFGSQALAALVSGTGQNSAFGYNSAAGLTTGSNNQAFGWQSLVNLLTGTHVIAIGTLAGQNLAGAESSDVYLNNDGVLGESNVLRIGSATGTGSQQLNKAFISGIRGITTGVNDAVAVLVDSADQLGTVSSSIRFKENVEDMADNSSALMNLRPVVFNYKDDVDHNLQTGLIAEEVLEIMPRLVVFGDDELPLTIKYHELGPLLLNELQKLAKRVEELESKLSNCCKE